MHRSTALAFLLTAGLAACATPPSRAAFDEGVLFYRNGYYLSAREAFDAALRQDPALASAWNNRGVARVRLGDLEGAVLDYTEAMRRAPGEAEYVFNRANAYAAGGNLVQALADYTTAVARRPDYTQAYYNRGTVRAVSGDLRGAAEDWRFAVTLERDPWTRAAMERGAPIEGAYAMPGALSGGTAVVMPASSPPGAVATPARVEPQALVSRAMTRELEGDRLGAIVDLKAALDAESDPVRRARIDQILRLLESAR